MGRDEVYVGLGGNIGNTRALMQSALQQISCLDGVYDLSVSAFYATSPVSDLPQPFYLNAVCRFKTDLTLREMFSHLKHIESLHGKTAKPKNAPRTLDLDLLFFGTQRCCDHDMEVPHPRWRERLFVLVPLSDLTTHVSVPTPDYRIESIDIRALIRSFPSRLDQNVYRLPENLPSKVKTCLMQI